MPEINLAPGAEAAGLPAMIAEMIRANLKNRPERIKDFNALNGNIYIQAEDAEVDMTMEFSKGRLTVYSGRVGTPMISIATDSVTLLDLANINIKFGMPYYFDDMGMGVLKKIIGRELKLKGLFTHPLALTRLTKILSVA